MAPLVSHFIPITLFLYWGSLPSAVLGGTGSRSVLAEARSLFGIGEWAAPEQQMQWEGRIGFEVFYWHPVKFWILGFWNLRGGCLFTLKSFSSNLEA